MCELALEDKVLPPGTFRPHPPGGCTRSIPEVEKELSIDRVPTRQVGEGEDEMWDEGGVLRLPGGYMKLPAESRTFLFHLLSKAGPKVRSKIGPAFDDNK